MEKDIKELYKEIIFKIGYYRNKNNLSARETSLQLGFSDSFVNRIESINPIKIFRNCKHNSTRILLS